MSINQIDHFLRPYPLPNIVPDPDSQHIFHFMYDQHYRWEMYQVVCPSAKPVGAALLRNWTWHINSKGKPNLRCSFDNGQGVSQDPMTRGTYGFVFRVLREDDEKLHAKYSVDRVRTAQNVQVKLPNSPNKYVQVPAFFYWDPQNTTDGSNKLNYDKSKNQRANWTIGLMRLKLAGVPPCYIARTLEIVMGLRKDESPIYVNPQDLAYTSPSTTQRPPAPKLQSPPRRPQGQVMIGRAEQAIQARTLSTLGQLQSAVTPQLGARPQSPHPNIKLVKKRPSESGSDGGHLLKKKKLPPGPSNLRTSTLA